MEAVVWNCSSRYLGIKVEYPTRYTSKHAPVIVRTMIGLRMSRSMAFGISARDSGVSSNPVLTVRYWCHTFELLFEVGFVHLFFTDLCTFHPPGEETEGENWDQGQYRTDNKTNPPGSHPTRVPDIQIRIWRWF